MKEVRKNPRMDRHFAEVLKVILTTTSEVHLYESQKQACGRNGTEKTDC